MKDLRKFMAWLGRRARRTRRDFTLAPLAPPPGGPSHYLSIATMVRNEAPRLREWIEFHRLVGVAHFTIYDNGSSDNTAEVLAPYCAAGLAEIVPWPHFLAGHHTQVLAWAHAIAHAGLTTRWLAFIDVDEYLFVTDGPSVAAALRPYEDLPALLVYWLMFGPSGHVEPPPVPMIEAFTRRAPVPRGHVRCKTLANFKPVIQPARVVAVSGTHRFHCDDGSYGYDERRRPAGASRRRCVSVEHFRLNHYYTRSLSEWHARYGGGRAANLPASGAALDAAFAKVERAPVEDRAIMRFLPQLRAALATAPGGRGIGM